MMVDELEKKIIHHLQDTIPFTERPFADIATKIGISEKDLIESIKGLKEKGILRRFGAILYHQRAGVKTNVMVAWKVSENIVDEVGALMAGFEEISHCYKRKIQGDWKYNLFTMIHSNNKNDFKKVLDQIIETTGVKDYIMLSTLKEFKKVSPTYY